MDSAASDILGVAGKAAVVTGAGSGMGLATSKLLAQLGCNVLCVDLKFANDQPQASSPGIIIQHVADTSDYAQAEKAVSKCVEEFGSVDILVNCAGVMLGGTIFDFKFEDWERTLAVNLRGYLNFAKAASAVMVKNGVQGRIVNISSTSAFMGEIGQLAYCASKGGVVSLTQVLALDLAPHKIRVNSVAPGWVDTPFATRYIDDQTRRTVSRRIPLGYIAPPEELARNIVFLASDMSRFMTGNTIVVDGGQTVDASIPGVEY